MPDAPRSRSHARRRSQIVELVQARGSARVDDLANRFGVSTMTIYRDLDHLHSRGLLRKVRSGAEAPTSEASERNLDLRASLNTPEKKSIAEAGFRWADERVHLQAVALDDSTTCLQLLPLLLRRQPLTVVTNFLPVITALAGEPGVRLNAVGGEYERDFSSFIGSRAVEALGAMHYDVAFMSVTAVTRGMCFHPSSAAADMKLAFLRSAELRVLLIDHTKLARRAVHRICSLADFDAVVVDAGASAEDLDELAASDANVVVAQTAAAATVTSEPSTSEPSTSEPSTSQPSPARSAVEAS